MKSLSISQSDLVPALAAQAAPSPANDTAEAPAATWRMQQSSEGDAAQDDLSATVAFRVPSFGQYSQGIVAETARRAGRLNAASVSDAEHKSLLSERQLLLDRRFSGDITRREELRLEYVRWSLDRIEDARYGDFLDQLDGAVRAYEAFAEDLQALKENVERARKRTTKGK